MSSKPLKILVSGDVKGKFKTLFSRVSNIEKKNGPFDLLLCVGDFFGEDNDEWEKYLQKELKVPISVLVLGANQENHLSFYPAEEGAELCDNVTFLGRRGLYSGSSGLQIAYLSGTEAANSGRIHFSEKDVNELIDSATSKSQQFKGVDILITSQWSKGVEKYATTLDSIDSNKCGSSLITKLALMLRPRYHFVGMQGVFYERQPYRNHQVLQESAQHVTRYISLAEVGNADKMKYLYAFTITPLTAMNSADLTHQPQDVTECPYKLSELKDIKPIESDSQQFFFDMNPSKAKGQKRQNNDGGTQKKKHKPAQPTGPCWFCLRGDKVEKHLVVSVGETTYLALAKGGLVPDHVLILPIGHYQSTVTAPPEAIEEIEKYKSSLKKYFRSIGKAVVFFERNFKTSHLQIQVIPVPVEKAANVIDAFQDIALEESVDLNEIPKHSDLKQIIPVEAPYFFVEVPTGEKLLCRISKFIQLQFGRAVLSSPMVLNMPERVDWKQCSLSQDEETQNAKDFKKMFRNFDFNFT